MAPSLSHTIQPAILPQQSPTPPDHPLWLKVLCSHVPPPPQCFLLVSLQGCGAQPLHPLSQHLLSLWHGLLLSSRRDPRRHRGRRWLCAVHLFWWDFLLGESWQSPSVPFNHIHPHPHKSNSQTILFPLKSAPAATNQQMDTSRSAEQSTLLVLGTQGGDGHGEMVAMGRWWPKRGGGHRGMVALGR